jgi:two-component sensor histidine kinase
MQQGGKDGVVSMTQPEWATDGRDGVSLAAALRHANIAVMLQDTSLIFVWTEHPANHWVSGAAIGKTDADILPESAASAMTVAKTSILSGGPASKMEIELADADGARAYEIWLDPHIGPDGSIDGVITTAIEITEQKLREQTLRTLLREVSHRSKNLLAIIQSIAAQTGRYSDSITEFLTRFRGRLQSLSSSQDLVTSSNWRGADLGHLVTSQIARYCADPAHNIRLTGLNPYLNPNAALHVGLALHELAINSVSYGALSLPDGFVTIDIHRVGDPDAGAMELLWSETLPSGEAALDRKKFGTVALERVVPASLNSSATLSAENGELFYRLLLPADSFHAE